MSAADLILADSYNAPSKDAVPQLARRGVAWSLGSSLCRQLIGLAATAVLARTLSATDYGLLGMVATLTALAVAIGDFGLSWATVQRRELTSQQVDWLFVINVVVGLLLSILCATAGPFLVSFYHRPELAGIALVIGSSFFFSGCAVQPVALLRRQMRFKELSSCDLTSFVFSSIVAVSAALMGYGYWSLAIQPVVLQLTYALLVLYRSGYVPKLPRSGAGVPSMLSFGGFVAGSSVLFYISRNMDNVLIGKFCGVEQLGYYARAYFLMTLPTMLGAGMLAGVMVPALSALQGDPARMANAHHRAICWSALLGIPMATGLAVLAPEFVRFVYGPKWTPVGPILVWLCIAGVIQPVQGVANWLYLVTGRGRALFFVGLGISIVTVAAFALGVKSGPVGVARAYAIANTICAGPQMFIAYRIAHLRIRRALAEVAKILASAAVTGLVAFTAAMLLHSADYRLRLLTGIAAGGCAYIICLRVWARDSWQEVLQAAKSTFDASLN